MRRRSEMSSKNLMNSEVELRAVSASWGTILVCGFSCRWSCSWVEPWGKPRPVGPGLGEQIILPSSPLTLLPGCRPGASFPPRSRFLHHSVSALESLSPEMRLLQLFTKINLSSSGWWGTVALQ